MTGQTVLDAAHAAMEAAPQTDALRLRFYERLADAELFLLLDAEAAGKDIAPRVFATEDGRMVLVFDREDRLAAFAGAAAPYAAMPGRVIARLLTDAGTGTGLVLNPGLASAFVMPAEALIWLARTLGNAPRAVEARPRSLHPPGGLPEALIAALDTKLALAAGLARSAYLVGVTYERNRRSHMLAFVEARPGAEAALAQAVAEALTFSGAEAGELDVGFFSLTDDFAAQLARHGLRFDLPVPASAAVPTPQAPGSDPQRPPRLR